ncbi:MAG: glycerophosphodiester phosphodiesterase [Gordonia amarae]
MTLVFAHRGGADHGGRENSSAAFARALRAGVQLESDIRLSRDGEPVLIHDVVRLIEGVPVAPALLSADALGSVGVLRLADLYRLFGTAFELSLDVKVVGAAWPAIEVARAAGAVERMWLVHEDRGLLRSLRAHEPAVRLVHEATERIRGAAGFDHDHYLDSLAADRIDAQNSPPEGWTADAVAAAHTRGILAFGSLLNDNARLSRAATLGLDAVYTDEIAMASAVFGR